MFDFVFNTVRAIGIGFLVVMIAFPQLAIKLVRSSAFVLYPEFPDKFPRRSAILVRAGGLLALGLYLRPYVRAWLGFV